MSAYSIAQMILDADQKEYTPPCSLVYSELREEETKPLRTALIADGALQITFPVTGIELWQTEGFVRDWRLIKTFPFGGV